MTSGERRSALPGSQTRSWTDGLMFVSGLYGEKKNHSVYTIHDSQGTRIPNTEMASMEKKELPLNG